MAKKEKIRSKTVRRYFKPSEQSPYWDDFESRRQKEGLDEHPKANPDVLCEDEAMYASSQPSTPQMLFGEAVEHLQGRQREVYLLTMREDRSIAEAAEMLGITKGSAQKYRDRAIRFISQYCHSAIEKGRV